MALIMVVCFLRFFTNKTRISTEIAEAVVNLTSNMCWEWILIYSSRPEFLGSFHLKALLWLNETCFSKWLLTLKEVAVDFIITWVYYFFLVVFIISSSAPIFTFPCLSLIHRKNYDINIQRHSSSIPNRLCYPGLLHGMSAYLHQAHQQLGVQSNGVCQFCAENEKFLLHKNWLF